MTYLKGYGKADGSGTAVTPQTSFVMGSVGKTITALAIRQLANQGLIDYQATIQTYIPWFMLADRTIASQIKIVDLIHHRSGLSRASGLESWVYNNQYTVEQIVRKLDAVMPNRPAGSVEEYSNLNYVIFALIIETVSGTVEQPMALRLPYSFIPI